MSSPREVSLLWQESTSLVTTISPIPVTVPGTDYNYLWPDRVCDSRREQHWRRGGEKRKRKSFPLRVLVLFLPQN